MLIKKQIEDALKVYKTTEAKIEAVTSWLFADLRDLKKQKDDIGTIGIYARNLCAYIDTRKKLIKELNKSKGVRYDNNKRQTKNN